MFSTQYLDAIGGFLTFMLWWFVISAGIFALGTIGGISYLIYWLLS